MKPKDNRKIEEICTLKKIDVSGIVLDKKFEQLESSSFKPVISTFGGIIDIRPKINITSNTYYKSIKMNTFGRSKYATMYSEFTNCPNKHYTLCFGYFNAMKIVKKLLHMINSPVKVRVLNINISGDESYILRDLGINHGGIYDDFQFTDFSNSIKNIGADRIILSVSTRYYNQYGHYTLAIIEKGLMYSFDPVNMINRDTIKIFERQNIKYMGSIYSLNPKCYKTLGHQDMKSHYCSLWSACLALTLGMNPDKSLMNVFDYFGVKAFSKSYLHKKIKSFAVYLDEFKHLM